MKIVTINNHVVVKPSASDSREDISEGVVQVGAKNFTYKKGDRVLYGTYSGQKYKDYIFLKTDQIIALIE